jgi:DNA invertase Pin-like site-specific DNA recombinase
MVTVLEIVQDYKIDILLAKETFNAKIAPIRAWVAQMELDGMKERIEMGVKARLKAGKANTGQDRYGYVRIGEQIHIQEEEAKWVHQIFTWYIQKTPLNYGFDLDGCCFRWQFELRFCLLELLPRRSVLFE